jgi:hypothetical protein
MCGVNRERMIEVAAQRKPVKLSLFDDLRQSILYITTASQAFKPKSHLPQQSLHTSLAKNVSPLTQSHSSSFLSASGASEGRKALHMQE